MISQFLSGELAKSTISRSVRFWLFWLLIVVSLAWSDSSKAQSQTDLPSYWQYTMSGRLEEVVPADINLDGVSEFLLIDENNHLDLINNSGKILWGYIAPEKITAIGIVHTNDEGQPQPTIAVGMPGQIVLLSSEGEVIWQASINFPVSEPASTTDSFTGSTETAGSQAVPVAIESLYSGDSGSEEILVLLESGILLRYDLKGNATWSHTEHRSDNPPSPPHLLVSDLDQDGKDEIVLAVLNPRRYGQVVFIDDGRVFWDLSLSRSVTDLQELRFGEDGQPLFAVSTTSGHVSVYDHLRRRHWLRTLNTPATSLSALVLPKQSLLAVGTEAGTVTVFNEQGRRLWTTNIAEDPDRAVLALSAAQAMPLNDNEPLLVATLQSSVDTNAAEAYLLDAKGIISARIDGVDERGLTQFVDSNLDKNNELLVSRFATLELLGMGVGSSSHVQEWEYSLNAAPSSALVADLEGDGIDELIVATSDGRVHSLSNDRTINWLIDAGEEVHDLALLKHPSRANRNLVLTGSNEDETGRTTGWIQLREANGERIWESTIESQVTSLLVANVVPGGDPEIIAGTDNGKLIVLSLDGETLWELAPFSGINAISHLAYVISEQEPLGKIIAASNGRIASIEVMKPGMPTNQIAGYPAPITALIQVGAINDQMPGSNFFVATEDGLLHLIDSSGFEFSQSGWPMAIDGLVTTGEAYFSQDGSTRLPTPGTQLLLGSDAGEFFRLDLSGMSDPFTWLFQSLGTITDVHWVDQNSDGNPDVAMAGNRDGRITLYDNADGDAPVPSSAPLDLASAVFTVETLANETNPLPDLLAVGENGLVQLFRDQENRPPLLSIPVVVSGPDQYNISVNVVDVEGDEVLANLEVFDPQAAEWIEQGAQLLSDGSGTLFWSLASPPESPSGLNYQFKFSDGSYTSTMRPPAGPPPILTSPWASAAPIIFLGIGITGLVLGLAYLRQARTPDARAARFYQRMRENPSQTLLLLEEQIKSGNSPDLMPHLAGHARKADDKVVNSLADGLFLLPEQPLSGIPILNQLFVDTSTVSGEVFEEQLRWQSMCNISQVLLEAPSVTDLSLLAPTLDEFISQLNLQGVNDSAFQLLIPVITNLRDSERVDLAEDRLVYLNEASASMKRTRRRLLFYAPSLEYLLVSAIARRWSGLITAEINDLHGRAELVVTLKTKRLVPGEHSTVAMDILNNGRSVAENIVVILDENPAFIIHEGQQEIVYLPPGRSRELRFTISPQVADRFRISLMLTYSDHSEAYRTAAFGDMVHMLPPQRDFSEVENPYTPGTPLRQGSLLFYGRESLFSFIAENAGRHIQRNVTILVGQRRTGKTSALLHLADHLPANQIPVYIDCQSLGVVPGMPALLDEFAWLIADALSKRNIYVDVPTLEAWQKDPTRLFERHFLPQVNALLPDDGMLLLVFDEFEAFETLVADEILPSTFFTYLRHLMQHSEHLNFIFVGTRRLEEMTSDYWSVLFNIALYRKIGFLDNQAATRLITEPVSPNLIYDDLALDKILRVTAGHPYFLQLVCYTLVKQANEQRSGYITISDLNAAIDEMLSLGEVHFAYLWQRSTMAERAILVVVAHLMDYTLPFHVDEIINRLKQFDINLDLSEVVGALNSLVERDILREVTFEAKSLYEVKLGLVCSWVARNKSVSKLYAGKDSSSSNGRQRAELVGK